MVVVAEYTPAANVSCVLASATAFDAPWTDKETTTGDTVGTIGWGSPKRTVRVTDPPTYTNPCEMESRTGSLETTRVTMVDGVAGFVAKIKAPGPLIVKVIVHDDWATVGVNTKEDSREECVAEDGEKVPQVAEGVTVTL